MRVSSAFVLLPVLTLLGCGGGGGGGGSPTTASPPPASTPPPSGIQVTLNRIPGSSAQFFSAVVKVGTQSDRATDRAPAVFDAMAPGNYVVEIGSPTAGCQTEGNSQQDVAVANGGLVTATFDVSCTFTPESRIVFRRFKSTGGDEFTVWTIRSDGTDLQQLATHPALFPTWSKDGTRIAYWGAGDLIWIMNWDGSEKTSLSPFPASQSTWSPDGTQLAFTSCCAHQANGIKPDIWMINIDGTGLTQLTTDGQSGTSAGQYLRVDWSPDGSMIAFDKGFEIGIIDTNGSRIAALGPGASPHWSLDGSLFIFRGVPPPPATPSAQIWEMNIDGSARKQMTDIPPDCGAPSYRSDGVEILFQCPLATQDPNGFVWRMNEDGSSARQFVEIPGPGSGDADWFTP